MDPGYNADSMQAEDASRTERQPILRPNHKGHETEAERLERI